MSSVAIQRLTSSRLGAMRRCPRMHYYRYELGLARSRQAAPLRFGSAFHLGMEQRNNGRSCEDAIIEATAEYQHLPQWADATEWDVESQTVSELLAGHFWRYSQDNLKFIAVERSFDIPLVNPDSGATSRTFSLAGKIDAIVQLPDGRLAVLEYKTTSENIESGSEYWQRLRCDGQISMYFLAARELGYDVQTVIYDVTRKPTIRLRQNETPVEYGKRLASDILERPDYYYQRREIPRLDGDLDEFRAELWQQADLIRESRNRSRWFRNVGVMTCRSCEFADICLQSLTVDPHSGQIPSGYQLSENIHPELVSE